MFIHEKLMLHALNLGDQYHIETIGMVGELCQAGHILSALNDNGIRKLHDELKEKARELE